MEITGAAYGRDADLARRDLGGGGQLSIREYSGTAPDSFDERQRRDPRAGLEGRARGDPGVCRPTIRSTRSAGDGVDATYGEMMGQPDAVRSTWEANAGELAERGAGRSSTAVSTARSSSARATPSP